LKIHYIFPPATERGEGKGVGTMNILKDRRFWWSLLGRLGFLVVSGGLLFLCVSLGRDFQWRVSDMLLSMLTGVSWAVFMLGSVYCVTQPWIDHGRGSGTKRAPRRRLDSDDDGIGTLIVTILALMAFGSFLFGGGAILDAYTQLVYSAGWVSAIRLLIAGIITAFPFLALQWLFM